MNEQPSAEKDAGRQYAELVARGAIIRCRRIRPFGAETPCACADECNMDRPFSRPAEKDVCVCPTDYCLGAEGDTGSTVECSACLALDPEAACLRDTDRMAHVSDEAVRVAEDVWTEDEPTLAEYELTDRILRAARVLPPAVGREARDA